LKDLTNTLSLRPGCLKARVSSGTSSGTFLSTLKALAAYTTLLAFNATFFSII